MRPAATVISISITFVLSTPGCVKQPEVHSASAASEAVEPEPPVAFVGAFKLKGRAPLHVDEEQLSLRLGYVDGAKDGLVLELCPEKAGEAACVRHDVTTARRTGRSIVVDKWLVTATREARSTTLQVQVYRLKGPADDATLAAAATGFADEGSCKHARRVADGIRDGKMRAARWDALAAKCGARYFPK